LQVIDILTRGSQIGGRNPLMFQLWRGDFDSAIRRFDPSRPSQSIRLKSFFSNCSEIVWTASSGLK
jgi:hypothetical protein